MKKLIDINSLALWLDVKPKTIRSWVNAKAVPHIKVGRLVKFDQEEIEKWIEKRKVKVINISSFIQGAQNEHKAIWNRAA